jgi:hypothetical protein
MSSRLHMTQCNPDSCYQLRQMSELSRRFDDHLGHHHQGSEFSRQESSRTVEGIFFLVVCY